MRVLTSLFIAASVLPATLATAETSTWQISDAQVHVICPMTVGGSFDASTRALSGVLTEASKAEPFEGAIAVDLRTLDSGIGLRDEHMRDTYLEVGRAGFDKAVLTELRVADVDPRTFEGRAPFSGKLQLHGTEHAIAGQARVRRDGPSARVEATFTVKLSDYGIAKPQYLGIGIRDEVEIKVSLVATPGVATHGAAR